MLFYFFTQLTAPIFSFFSRAGWLDIAMRFLVFTTTSIGHRFYFLNIIFWILENWTDGRTYDCCLSYVNFLSKDGTFHLEFFIFLGGIVDYCFSRREGTVSPPTHSLMFFIEGGKTDGQHEDDGIHVLGLVIYE